MRAFGHDRVIRAPRHTLLRLIGAVAAVALTLALSATGGTAQASPTKTPAPNYWTKVHSHGRTIMVHPRGRFGIVPQRGRMAPKLQGDLLQYGGGPVQHNPTVFLVFWGNQWDSDQNGVASYMQGFFTGVGQPPDQWSASTSQYTDNTGQGPTYGNSVLGGVWTDDAAPSPTVTSASDIAAEAVAGAQHFGVSGDDVDIFVVSPSGSQPDGFPNAGFCAYHSATSSSVGTVPYTNMPYVLDLGSSCGENSVQNALDGFSIVGGHEFAEAATDPEPSSGWVDSQGEENGDKCAWMNLHAINLSSGSFAVQPLWSNAIDGCAG